MYNEISYAYYVFCVRTVVTFNGGTGKKLKMQSLGSIVKRVFCIYLLLYSYLYISQPHHENKALGGDIYI